MVDEDRVLRLLRSIADGTAVLRQEARASEERRQDPIWLRGVKYTFPGTSWMTVTRYRLPLLAGRRGPVDSRGG